MSLLTRHSAGARVGVARLSGMPWRYYLGHAIARLSGLAVLPVVSRVAGAEGLGRFEVALSVMIAATVLIDAGIGSAVIRFGQEPGISRSALIGSAASLQVGAALVAATIFVPAMLLLGPDDVSAALLVFATLTFAVVESFAVLGSGILRSEAKDALFLRLCCSRFVIATGIGTVCALAIGGAGALLGVACGGLGFASYTLLRWWRSRSLGSAAVRKRLARYGLPLTATTLGMWTMSLSDRLFLRDAVTPEALGRYAANYRVGSVILIFFAAPLALAWFAEAQRTEARLRGRRARSWLLGFSFAALGCGAILIAACPFLVPKVFGDGIDGDRFVVACVVLSGWLAGAHYIVATPMVVGNATARLAVVSLATVAVTFALNGLLIPAFGTHGAAAATLAAYGTLCALTALAARRKARE
jgi:O-antigen/teichoic acid export membrane protein